MDILASLYARVNYIEGHFPSYAPTTYGCRLNLQKWLRLTRRMPCQKAVKISSVRTVFQMNTMVPSKQCLNSSLNAQIFVKISRYTLLGAPIELPTV